MSFKSKENSANLFQMLASKEPSPRAGCSLVYHPKANCILFGGASHEDGVLNDIYQLNHSKLFLNQANFQWNQIEVKSEIVPNPRYEHSSQIVERKEDLELLVMFGTCETHPFGDVWSFNLTTNKWSLVETSGKSPCPRVLKASALVKCNEKQRIYIFGGGKMNNEPVKDTMTYCLDVGELTLTRFDDMVHGVWIQFLITLCKTRTFTYGSRR